MDHQNYFVISHDSLTNYLGQNYNCIFLGTRSCQSNQIVQHNHFKICLKCDRADEDDFGSLL